MRLGIARMFPVMLMVALALLTFYLDRAVREEQVSPALRRHDPDYIVTNFTSTTYDRDGEPLTVLSAARMVHFPDDDTTELVAPRILQTKPHEPRFSVSAERGSLSGSGDEVFLYDNVVLLRDATAGGPSARLTTSFLHLLRDRSLARTDREVTIVEERRSLRGRGMDYNNDTREFNLYADVHGRFESPK